VVCYSELYAASAVVVMLNKMCEKMQQDYVPVILKPASLKGRLSFECYFTDLLANLDTNKYLIYDENLCVNKLSSAITVDQFKNTCEVELLEIVRLEMSR
jgi:hypothetical protein